jgi:uncharacterized phage protein (TIGR01671 family)
MRKYRVWCKNKNEWEKDPVCLLPDGTLIDQVYHVALRPDTHIVQFSTGLLDKNGKEIYEGDIIIGSRKESDANMDGWGRNLPYCPRCDVKREPAIVSDKYIVEYNRGRFFLQRQPVHGAFDFYYNDTIEVIGNIYENKDAL